jgi:hypothetical protein
MGVDIRTHRHVILSGPPTTAVQCLEVGMQLLRLMPDLLQPDGLVVLTVRAAELEPWEVRGIAPGPHVDDLIRAIAAYGEQPEAVIVPHAYVVRDPAGHRAGGGLRILAECGGRRAALELRVGVEQGAATPLVPRDLGPAPEPGWIGVPPPGWMRLQAVGPLRLRPTNPSDFS